MTTASPRDADFTAQVESYRHDLTLLCYRFLGSLADAEEAVQETVLRAWRGRSGFRAEAGIRTWLHRIATRVCLDMAERRRRALPYHLRAAPSDPTMPPDAPSEVPWLEPLPAHAVGLLGGGTVSGDPVARSTVRESVSLAFTAALQTLPASQRAVLLLRDVLGWSAAEAAETLDITVGAANSALFRARRTMERSHHRSGRDALSVRDPDDPLVRRLLAAYVDAWERDDVEALVATLRDDVRLAMPPSPSWYAGPASVGELLRRWVFGVGAPMRLRMRPVAVNGGPGGLLEERGHDAWTPIGVHAVTIEGDGIVDIVVFMDPAIVGRFAGPDGTDSTP